MRKCGKCGETKPSSEFTRKWRGIHSQCKDCVRKYMAAWRNNNRERYNQYSRDYNLYHPLEKKARGILYRAILAGTVVKPELCQGCNKAKPLQGHHEDYTQPLEVEWLCKDCHEVRDLGISRKSVEL